MNLLENELYQSDIEYVAEFPLPWKKLRGKSILISGAGGLIGSCLIDVLMKKNESGLGCHVYALGRNVGKAKKRFNLYWRRPDFFEFITHDINEPLSLGQVGGWTTCSTWQAIRILLLMRWIRSER